MNYRETTEYLFSSMPSFQNVGGDAYKPGLERIRAFCERLGNPHKSYTVIHIAGTNGKGSSSHMLASVLAASGYSVGLFTSPHLRDFRERMRVDGEVISESEVVDFVDEWRGEMESLQLSFFEMTAAMAFNHFARCEVDVAVIETGLGGRLDATNIVKPALSIITNIGIDHTHYLGDTIAQIAAEKGGIIKRGVPVVVGERGAESAAVFEERAREMGARIIYAEDLYSLVGVAEFASHQCVELFDAEDETTVSYDLDLKGEYQRKNIVTVLAAIDTINGDRFIPIDTPQRAIEQGLRSVVDSTSLIGRWQEIGTNPTIICDTGHNDHGVREVTRQLARQKYAELYCVVGFARDKELRKILALFPEGANFIFTRAGIERAFDTSEIASVAEELGLKYECIDEVQRALRRAQERAQREDLIFVGGSTFVVAEIEL
ncbi:MAG: folylpolyglutamate synthase/dihydrofolate synthase family protein [Rikenellaceae bacterium]